MRPFYAVKMISGVVMAFDWNAEHIAAAYQHKRVVGVIRCFDAEGTIPAEAEAERLFAKGQFDPTDAAKSK